MDSFIQPRSSEYYQLRTRAWEEVGISEAAKILGLHPNDMAGRLRGLNGMRDDTLLFAPLADTRNYLGDIANAQSKHFFDRDGNHWIAVGKESPLGRWIYDRACVFHNNTSDLPEDSRNPNGPKMPQQLSTNPYLTREIAKSAEWTYTEPREYFDVEHRRFFHESVMIPQGPVDQKFYQSIDIKGTTPVAIGEGAFKQMVPGIICNSELGREVSRIYPHIVAQREAHHARQAAMTAERAHTPPPAPPEGTLVAASETVKLSRWQQIKQAVKNRFGSRENAEAVEVSPEQAPQGALAVEGESVNVSRFQRWKQALGLQSRTA
jgi:hypothetical protein